MHDASPWLTAQPLCTLWTWSSSKRERGTSCKYLNAPWMHLECTLKPQEKPGGNFCWKPHTILFPPSLCLVLPVPLSTAELFLFLQDCIWVLPLPGSLSTLRPIPWHVTFFTASLERTAGNLWWLKNKRGILHFQEIDFTLHYYLTPAVLGIKSEGLSVWSFLTK